MIIVTFKLKGSVKDIKEKKTVWHVITESNLINFLLKVKLKCASFTLSVVLEFVINVNSYLCART